MARKRKGNVSKRRTKKRNTSTAFAKGVKPILDTPENIARALFGIKRKEKEEENS